MARATCLLALLGVLGRAAPLNNSSSSSVKVSWIGDAPSQNLGTTFGLPWPQGKYRPGEVDFQISDGQNPLPLQSWVTGYWRDGSIKWSAHAIPRTERVADEYTIEATPVSKRNHNRERERERPNQTTKLSVKDGSEEVTVDTGKITVSFPKQGRYLVSSIKTSGGKTVGKDGRLVLYSQDGVPETADDRADAEIERYKFESKIEEVTVSKNDGNDNNNDSVRALVTVRGNHTAIAKGASPAHGDWLPFVVRFYLYADSDAIRLVHSITFDGRYDSDFISGLGIQFRVPLGGEELYNRHVRLAGTDGGFLNEAVKGITGLRRDPGAAVRTAQIEGKALPAESTWDTRVSSRLQWIPAWNDYRLSQLSPDGFTLKKRTKAGQSWVKIPGGTRAGGLAYLGGATRGGLAVALRDFWKRYPTGLDVSGAASDDEGQITLWLYSPEAEPLDLRPYHDGMGQDTYEKQLDALEITYEDYEAGFDTPYGIARTSEVFLFAFEATPPSDELAERNALAQVPPALAAPPGYIRETRALGSYWALPAADDDDDDDDDDGNAAASSSSSPGARARAKIETNLDFLVRHYQKEVEARRWYGFLDHGDVMHTYDADRHQWRYDVGGYAWDNSELSPDLFVWQYFLRTGRADVYRFAEALTRHTGEVDSYHIGDWKGLGTRHGVAHWADSAKQARISQPQYRKYFFYLSGGDERTGELLEHTLDADKTYGILDPQRKVRTDGWKPSPGAPVTFGLGTDWAALAAGWLIEWERRGPRWEEARRKLEGTASGIAALRNGFVTGSGSYVIENGTLLPPPADPANEGVVAISHLNAVFGMPEVVSELLEYWGDEAPAGFRAAWLDYAYYYGATAEEQRARYGTAFSGVSLRQAHSRLAAYYAVAAGPGYNATVAARAWDAFRTGDGIPESQEFVSTRVQGSAVLHPVDEAAWLATNDFAQYGLASIQNLAYIGDSLED